MTTTAAAFGWAAMRRPARELSQGYIVGELSQAHPDNAVSIQNRARQPRVQKCEVLARLHILTSA